MGIIKKNQRTNKSYAASDEMNDLTETPPRRP